MSKKALVSDVVSFKYFYTDVAPPSTSIIYSIIWYNGRPNTVSLHITRTILFPGKQLIFFPVSPRLSLARV